MQHNSATFPDSTKKEHLRVLNEYDLEFEPKDEIWEALEYFRVRAYIATERYKEAIRGYDEELLKRAKKMLNNLAR